MNNQQPTNLGFGNFFGGNVPSINMNGGNQPPQENVKKLKISMAVESLGLADATCPSPCLTRYF